MQPVEYSVLFFANYLLLDLGPAGGAYVRVLQRASEHHKLEPARTVSNACRCVFYTGPVGASSSSMLPALVELDGAVETA